MADEMELLKEWIKTSKNIVFFGGAGVSTESNIPDFRSTDGLYNQEYDYPPETILSHSFYKKKPEEFFRFYRNKMLFPNAQPNAAHKALARLEQQGKLKAVITQNIDGLHYCEHCGRFYSLEDLMEKKELVPKCSCGGIIKPDVVLYEESLNQKTLEQSVRYISQADMLIVGGTSLTVYPAAGLIDYYRGNKLVLINMAATVRDGIADLIIKRKIGEALSEAVE